MKQFKRQTVLISSFVFEARSQGELLRLMMFIITGAGQGGFYDSLSNFIGYKKIIFEYLSVFNMSPGCYHCLT